jgi:N-acetylmuramic acid 6-phosphate (MurNAc-6-P) etherase
VKTAVVAYQKQITPEQARELLNNHSQHLRRALESFTSQ